MHYQELKGQTVNTKTNISRSWSARISIDAMALLLCFGIVSTTRGQGTLTFDQPKPRDNYYEQGFWFRILPSDPPLDFAHLYGLDDLGFVSSLSGYYVSLSRTDGQPFGLSSVDLNGRYYNGTTVQFNGYFEDGSMVSNSFSVPYDSQWNTHQFGSEFSSGLVRVDIPSYPWAMDNLAYVPEPSVGSLVLLGLLAWWRSFVRKGD